jgi:hypothetical protein
MYVRGGIVKKKGCVIELEMLDHPSAARDLNGSESFLRLTSSMEKPYLLYYPSNRHRLVCPGGCMPEEKNFFAGIFDFGFNGSLLRRLVKILYVLAIVFGGITVVAEVVVGYQQSPAQGLINLVAGIVSLFVGVLVVRALLELALVILRIAEGIERATHPGNQ